MKGGDENCKLISLDLNERLSVPGKVVAYGVAP